MVGRVVDAESGLIYLRNRYYDPSTGQWLTRDPAVALTRSAYGYVNDNPLNGTDPSGLMLGRPDWGYNDTYNSLGAPVTGCAPSSVSLNLQPIDLTFGAVHSTPLPLQIAYDVQGFIGRDIIRPFVGFNVVAFGFTTGSSTGLLVGDALCGGVGIPCAIAGGVIGGGLGIAAGTFVGRQIDKLLSKIPGWG